MKYYFLLLLVSFQAGFAQNNQLWKGYFSYSDIKDVTQSENQFIAASENALFSKNFTLNEIKTINTIDGLSSQTISTIYYSSNFKKTLIGYENGLLIVINETDGTILNLVDIIKKQLPPNIKKINHFHEFEGIIYISCDFGIVQFKLATLSFGDTYFIGNRISDIIVTQTTVLNGFIYAATISQGIKKAAINNPNLIDANQWNTVENGSFSGITSFQNAVFASSANGQVLRSLNGNTFANFGNFLSPAAVDIRATNNYLIIAARNKILIYNESLVLTTQILNTQFQNIVPIFSCATVINATIYIGTQENGVITTQFINTANFESISPNGPSNNNIFSINATSSNLWAVYGDYSQFYEPLIKSRGFSKFNINAGWTNFPFSKVNGAVDLVRVAVNPTNDKKIFISSYSSGLLEFENDELIKLHNQTNSGLEKLVFSDPNYVSIRIEQSVFDKDGNLWMTNGLIEKPLKKLNRNGTWQSFDISSVLEGYSPFGRMAIDKNGTKWMCNLENGLVGFNESRNNLLKKIYDDGEIGSLPSSSVQVAAIDNRNQIWIGTRKGLRVIQSVDSFFEDKPLTANSIIILEDGLAQELLNGQFITDIVVDGANNKWVSTVSSGVFMFSPNGQQTFYHFTSSNSPLPNNNVNDVDINPLTGEVFFATITGMVSFKGTAIKASDNLENVVVFPNPVRPGFDGTVKITGLLNKANIKITDIEGNLVYEVISEGGSIEWDTTAFGKFKVASGVYMIFISAQDGVETKVKKVMIIR